MCVPFFCFIFLLLGTTFFVFLFQCWVSWPFLYSRRAPLYFCSIFSFFVFSYFLLSIPSLLFLHVTPVSSDREVFFLFRLRTRQCLSGAFSVVFPRQLVFPLPPQTFGGPSSAVSKPIFATKYSFCCIFRDLQYLHTFAPLQTQNFAKSRQNCFEILRAKRCKSIKVVQISKNAAK